MRALRSPFILIVTAIGAMMLPTGAGAQSTGAARGPGANGAERYALIIGGLGGTPEYTQKFATYLSETRSLLINRFGFAADRVRVLAEAGLADRDFVDGTSSAENIREHIEELGRSVRPDDQVFILLFGHGSFDGSNAALNIPRRDLADAEYGELLDGIEGGRVIFINTSSASGPFAGVLAGPNRIVITATATGTERDETRFPQYLIEALRSPDADLDKNGALSVREAFVYASRQTARSYETAGLIITEHALLEDNGDGNPSRLEQVESEADGHLAAMTYFRPADDRAIASAEQQPVIRRIRELEQAIAELKSRKAQLPEDRYYDELEVLFVQLARLNDELERN